MVALSYSNAMGNAQATIHNTSILSSNTVSYKHDYFVDFSGYLLVLFSRRRMSIKKSCLPSPRHDASCKCCSAYHHGQAELLSEPYVDLVLISMVS